MSSTSLPGLPFPRNQPFCMDSGTVGFLNCIDIPSYSFPHNHGSGKWLFLKGNYYWRDPCSSSMIMGGRVTCNRVERIVRKVLINLAQRPEMVKSFGGQGTS